MIEDGIMDKRGDIQR